MTTRNSQLKALADRVQNVERKAFIDAAGRYLLAYHIGAARDPANMLEGFCKAMGYDAVNDSCSDVALALQGKKSTPDPYSKAMRRLLTRGGRRLPKTTADMDQAIYDLATALPLEWQDDIWDCARNDLADRGRVDAVKEELLRMLEALSDADYRALEKYVKAIRLG